MRIETTQPIGRRPKAARAFSHARATDRLQRLAVDVDVPLEVL